MKRDFYVVQAFMRENSRDRPGRDCYGRRLQRACLPPGARTKRPAAAQPPAAAVAGPVFAFRRTALTTGDDRGMAHLPDVAHGRLEIQAGPTVVVGSPASTRSLGRLTERRVVSVLVDAAGASHKLNL